MLAMYRLIHPFLQSRVELVCFGGEDQHVAVRQPDILSPRCRADLRAECAVRRPQSYARGRQDLGVWTPRNQQRAYMGPSQHAAHGAADSTGTNDHVSVVVMTGQLPRLP